MDYEKRLLLLDRELDAASLDSLLVTTAHNVTYLTGFGGHDAALLITRTRRYFITDCRYLEEASGTVRGFNIVLAKGSLESTVRTLAAKARLRKVGVESMNLPYERYRLLCTTIRGVAAPAPHRDIVERLREIKDPDEAAKLRQAAKLARSLLCRFSETVMEGETEVALATRLKMECLKHKSVSSFEPIVAIGPSASRPHAIPGEQKVSKDCAIMIDLGVTFDGYCSDITRTVFIGSTAGRIRRIFDVVRSAQEKAIKKIAPGVRICDIDRAARRFITGRGFGRYFGHALGHGVGLDVHERPAVSKRNRAPLREGMVFTVEPAIYIPGVCGVRIEDMVLVTAGGCEVMTGG